MTEQAPNQGSLGGVSYPYNREYVNVVLEEQGVLKTSLGTLETGDVTRYQNDEERLTERANYLLELLGVKPDDWKDGVVSTKVKNYFGERTFSGKRLRAAPETRHTASAAAYLHESTFMSMPMEEEVWGEGQASIVFETDDDIQIEFIGKGEYWRDRFYTHPKDGKEVSVREQGDGGGTDLWTHGVEPEYLGYEDAHSIVFSAVVTPIVPESAQLAA